QIHVLAAGGDLDEIHNIGAQYRLGHSAAADDVRGHDFIGAGPFELDIRTFLAGSRQDVKVRVEAPGGEGYIDVLRVGGDHRDQPLGAFDPGFEQGFIQGGVPLHVEVPFLIEFLDDLDTLLHNHEWQVIGLE